MPAEFSVQKGPCPDREDLKSNGLARVAGGQVEWERFTASSTNQYTRASAEQFGAMVHWQTLSQELRRFFPTADWQWRGRQNRWGGSRAHVAIAAKARAWLANSHCCRRSGLPQGNAKRSKTFCGKVLSSKMP